MPRESWKDNHTEAQNETRRIKGVYKSRNTEVLRLLGEIEMKMKEIKGILKKGTKITK